MGKRVPYGRVDLKSVREDGMLYIDKTMYLEKLEQNNVFTYKVKKIRKINAYKYACILL